MEVNPAPANNLMSGDISIRAAKVAAFRAALSRRRHTIKSVAALLSSNITAAVLTAIGGLLAAHFIGPAETGAYRVYTIPLTYLIFLHLGTWDGLGRQIPYYVGKEKPKEVDRLASAAGAFNVLISALISFGFLCCAAHSLARRDLHGLFGWLSQVLCCWGILYTGYLTSTYRTLNHFVTMARIQVVQTILTFAMVFSLPFLRFYGLCARASVPPFLGVLLFHRNRPLKVRYRLDIKALIDLLKIGLPFSFWGNVYSSFWTATESALVLSLSGVSSLGLFTIAAVMGGAINSIPLAVWQVLTPRVVTSFARDGSVRNVSGRLMWVTVGLTAAMVVLALIGSFLLGIFVPLLIPKYIAGIPVMKVWLWFPVVQAAMMPVNTLFATGRPWLYGRSVIAGAAVFSLATYLLYPASGGLLAVAVGSLLGRAARTLAAYVDLAVLTSRER